jgi:mannose-6-phosphate isomerase-like protein (cupin superfamily)
MNCSRLVRILVPTLFLFGVVLVPLPVRVSAQAPKGLQKNLFSHVMKSADVDAALAKIQDSWDVFVKTNHAVTFRVSTKKHPWTSHPDADEYWIVRRGSAKVALAPTGTTSGDARDVGAGDVVFVPRNIDYEIAPMAGRFEYVALRIFVPQQARGGGAGRGGAGRGGAPAPEPTSYVATKAQIDQTFATEPRTTQLRFPGGGSLNMIIYNGAIGPYESHETADQIYFVRYGTARAAYDGRLVDPKVTAPGQIRGTGYVDSSEYTIGPGDIVWIPRNLLHFVDPGVGKIGYLLAGIPTSQSALTPPPSEGRGGRGAPQ